MNKNIVKWARLLKEANAEDKSVVVVIASDGGVMVNMTSREVNRYKAGRGYGNSAQLRRTGQKSIMKFYLLDNTQCEELVDTNVFFSNIMRDTVLDKLEEYGIEPFLTRDVKGRTDWAYGDVEPTGFEEDMQRVYADYGRDIKIYCCQASYNDRMINYGGSFWSDLDEPPAEPRLITPENEQLNCRFVIKGCEWSEFNPGSVDYINGRKPLNHGAKIGGIFSTPLNSKWREINAWTYQHKEWYDPEKTDKQYNTWFMFGKNRDKELQKRLNKSLQPESKKISEEMTGDEENVIMYLAHQFQVYRWIFKGDENEQQEKKKYDIVAQLAADVVDEPVVDALRAYSGKEQEWEADEYGEHGMTYTCRINCEVQDFGIGAYEYWGAKGVDTNLQPVPPDDCWTKDQYGEDGNEEFPEAEINAKLQQYGLKVKPNSAADDWFTEEMEEDKHEEEGDVFTLKQTIDLEVVITDEKKFVDYCEKNCKKNFEQARSELQKLL